jgi:hypothetical protein
MQAFDFDNALDKHRAWKMRFQIALGSVQGKEYDTAPIGDAANCSLGKWLAANADELAGCMPQPQGCFRSMRSSIASRRRLRTISGPASVLV